MKRVVFVIAAACSQDKGASVKPQPVREVAPVTLSLDDYNVTVYGAGPQTTFRATTVKEHEAIARLVPLMLEGSSSANPPNPNTWQADAHAAGFRIEAWTIDGERYWALLEASGSARGAGAYIFRVGPIDGATILLEAPHNYFDVGTGRLAAELFFTQRHGVRPRALFTNTIHRYQLSPGDKKKRKVNPADVAHNADHAFTVATDAFVIAAGNVRVIQVHGFGARDANDEDDDDTQGGAAIAMVVSAGDAKGSSALSAAVAAAATEAFGSEVKRFPEDTKVLGATTNVQGRAIRKSGKGEFVHVEISAELRKQLAASADLRAKLAAVLFDAGSSPKVGGK